jgi:cyclophilin family peptidyl-prolyl cis-trans isomerase
MRKEVLLLILVCLGINVACKKKNDVQPAPAPVTGPKADSAFTYSVKDTDLMQVTFTSNVTSDKAKSIKWSFSDQTMDSGQTVHHTFTKTGSYTVRLTVTNANGTSSTTQTITFTESILQIHTSYGDMFMFLYRNTPKHRHNYLYLAKRGYFDSTTFHRVVPNFVIQGGDPNSKDEDTTNDGTGGEDTVAAEIQSKVLKHDYGMVGAARTPDQVNPQRLSNNSQFYIVVNKAGDHQLDGAYTVFGKIIKGMDVADKIAVAKADPANNRPYTDIRMKISVLQMSREDVKAQYGFDVP